MTDWTPAVSGDIGDMRTIRLSGAANLDAITHVEAHVWNATARATLAAEVLDAEAGTVRVHLGGADGWLATATSGAWNAEIQATFQDGSVLTWPAKGTDRIIVRAAGDPELDESS